MRRAVILAAGDGGRLGAHTQSLPKPLVSVAGKPLIQYTLDALADAGVEEAVVVTGHREAQLRDALRESAVGPRLQLVSNPHFHAGASLSLRAARTAAGAEPFLLVMADHLLSAPLLQRLSDSARPGVSLVAADFRPEAYHDVEEATRIRVDGRNSDHHRVVTAIGKHVAPFDALDAGAFWIDPSAWNAIDASPEDTELSTLFAELLRRGTLFAADVSGTFWFDVDTAEDLATAEDLVSGRAARGVA